jgi:hypothetical protein
MKGIITYGSLINPTEIELIAPDASYTPVKVNGFRRHFGQKSVFRKGNNGQRGVLTVEKEYSSWFNGLLMYSLTDDYITSYKERESGYNIKSVDIYDISSYPEYSLPEELTEVYIAIGDRSLENPQPIPSYLKICMEGAKTFSNEFLTDFVITTYKK